MLREKGKDGAIQTKANHFFFGWEKVAIRFHFLKSTAIAVPCIFFDRPS